MLSCGEWHPGQDEGPHGTLSRVGSSACCPGGAWASQGWCTDPCGPGLRGVESPPPGETQSWDAHHHSLCSPRTRSAVAATERE